MTKMDVLLSKLYASDDRAAYETVMELIKENEALQKKLELATSQEPTPHVVEMRDFNLMVSNASQMYVKRAFPVLIGKQAVSHGHEPHIFMIEAFIGHLNSHGILRKPVTFGR